MTKAEAGAMFLAVAPAALPDSENAAILYNRVFDQLKDDHVLARNDFDPKSDDPENLDVLQRHASALRLLRRGAAMPNCRFDRDWARPDIYLMLPELNQVRISAQLLQLDSRVELAAGHDDVALADVNAISGMAGHIGQEPILISGLVSFGVDGVADAALQGALGKVTRPAQLDALIGFDPAADHRTWQHCLRGEECFGMTTFAELQGGEVSPQYLILATQGGPTNMIPTVNNIVEPFGTLLRVFVLSAGLDSYMQQMDEYQTLARQPYYDAKARLDAIAADSETIKRQGYFQSVFMPTISRPFRGCAKAEAGDACAQVGIAATRYRLDHGSLPARLADLVPNYIDAVPLDPFDGNPLRLTTKGGQWTVYSISVDGRDDGGTPEAYDQKTRDYVGDITFTLPAVADSPATQPAR